MVKPYFPMISRAIFLIALTAMSLGSYALTPKPAAPRDSVKITAKPASKISDTRKNKPNLLKNGIKVNVIPFKPAPIKVAQSTVAKQNTGNAEDKILSNVKVYPNPVSDELNVNYFVSQDVIMTIKIMDFLGNEVATLQSHRVESGERTETFNINSRLNSGLYFIRLIAGNETVIKRISVQ